MFMSVVAASAAMLGAYLAGVRTVPDHAALLSALQRSLSLQLPIVVVLAAAVYVAYGVYGRVRALPAREKALQLLFAATLVYAALGLVQRLLPEPVQLGLPVLLWAWVLAAIFLIGSRTWSTAWRSLALAEAGPPRVTASGRGKPRVLVIGGAGYIGSALAPQLLQAGYRVRVLDLLLFGEASLAAVKDDPDFELVQADFRQVDRVVDAMEGVDAVVHLGGLVGDPACSLDERLTTEVNLNYTRLLAEVAKGAHVPRFVFASSCSVYGASDDILDEDSDLNPVSLYARSKIASENVLFDMATPAFAPTMLRFGTVYGLSDRMRFDLVVNLLAAKAVAEGKITVFGGDQWRPFVHVQDAARAVVAALQAPVETVRNEVFNVGSDAQNATLGDIGHMIQRLVPDAEYIDSGRDGDRRNYRVSFVKIQRTLGFRPELTLERGIAEVVEKMRSGAVRDFNDPVFSDVRFLKEGMAPRYTRVREDWAEKRMAGDVTHSTKARADGRLRTLAAEERAAAAAAAVKAAAVKAGAVKAGAVQAGQGKAGDATGGEGRAADERPAGEAVPVMAQVRDGPGARRGIRKLGEPRRTER